MELLKDLKDNVLLFSHLRLRATIVHCSMDWLIDLKLIIVLLPTPHVLPNIAFNTFWNSSGINISQIRREITIT
jgi:hypothetical protein